MTSQRIVFNSSFPRSGSTLLQNMLAQNPRFYCSATSGLMGLLMASRGCYTNGTAFKAQDASLMKAGFLGFCEGALAGYYRRITDKPVCVDKSRAWFHYYEWLRQFHPEPRILICIRDLRSVLSSMEKLFRKNRHLEDTADPPDGMHMVTVQNRITHWLNSTPVGLAAARLNEAVQTDTIRHFHIVRFEDLTSNPSAALKAIYAYLDEPEYEHDFENVEQTTIEDDSQHVFYGDHRIRRVVAPVAADYREVLGAEVSAMVKANNPDFYKRFYPDVRR